ncbi:MAG TPA: hypothetical protein GX512_06710 [Firmicutes bacterium]|nr:hypothetical protein [Candidatus Fermentithermobacillaceae bacterium]
MAFGTLARAAVGCQEAERRKMAGEFMDFLSWALIFGVVGARLAFVLISDPAEFIRGPVKILRVDLAGYRFRGSTRRNSRRRLV